MADATSQNEPPTYYANIVTVSVDADVVYMELRRYVVSHREQFRRAQSGGAEPPAGADALYAEEPVARVVITYTAAKTLFANLSDLLPKMQQARKETMDRND